MASEPEETLFEPDPRFAVGWHMDDPVAQGAFRHASVSILDHLQDAGDEIASSRPDLGDIGPLGFFPRGLRAALTPLLVDKLTAAATVMGWKLAQPGRPIRPVCLAEEFVLELIRREAVFALEIVGADRGSISATRGVYEVCEDDDALDLFEMREPADAALALGSPIHQMMGTADMRIEHWFDPFYGGEEGALHPLYLEAEEAPHLSDQAGMPLVEVEPGEPLKLDRDGSDSDFRVIIRLWDDAFLERNPFDQMPSTWVYYVAAPSADAALRDVRERFPEGATRDLGMEPEGEASLAREDLSHISLDVQRLDLPQAFSHGSFHLVGGLTESLDTRQLRGLAANLLDTFPHAVVTSDGAKNYFGVSVNAESHEEADAVVEEFFDAFADAAGLSEVSVNGSSNGQGARHRHELVEEIESYRRGG